MPPSRRTVERGWILVSVGYGGLRATLVWAFLRRYGVNPAVFVATELTSSFVYGLSSARAVGSVIDRRYGALRSWGPLALASYLAPDAYIFSAAGRMPGSVLSVVIAVFIVAATATTIGVLTQVRRAGGGGGGRESNPPDEDHPSRLF